MEFTKFKHKTETRVRSFHIDSQSIVHNAWYFFFLEDGRAEYYRSIGMMVDKDTFTRHHKMQVVRNTCDYKSPAYFDDVLEVFTRTAYIKNSSVGIEQYIIDSGTKRLIAEATGILVYLDSDTNIPERVPDSIREKIGLFEGENVEFLL